MPDAELDLGVFHQTLNEIAAHTPAATNRFDMLVAFRDAAQSLIDQGREQEREAVKLELKKLQAEIEEKGKRLALIGGKLPRAKRSDADKPRTKKAAQ